jgi:hypothetical protein
MLSELHTLVAGLEQNAALDDPARLRQRLEALDRLEAYGLDGPTDHPGGAELAGRARAIAARLEAINRALYQAIRRDIQSGAGPGRLLQALPRFGQPRRRASRVGGEGYDYLDALIGGVLQFAPPAAEVAEPAAEMVFYQPTPARHIFDLIDRAELSERDVLVDLGAGLGHVPLLAAICTGASSIGVELEAAYVECARRSASELNLTNVTFIQQDARAADFSSGTLFYLYTPFSGTILRAVLDSLRREAARRAIRIATYGPCTPTVAAEGWLAAVGGVRTDRVAIFRSRRGTHG